MKQPSLPEQNRPYAARIPLAFWLIWMSSIVATAGYTWWGTYSVGTPLNVTQIVLRSLIVGLVGLIVLTLIEVRLAPWRFMK